MSPVHVVLPSASAADETPTSGTAVAEVGDDEFAHTFAAVSNTGSAGRKPPRGNQADAGTAASAPSDSDSRSSAAPTDPPPSPLGGSGCTSPPDSTALSSDVGGSDESVGAALSDVPAMGPVDFDRISDSATSATASEAGQTTAAADRPLAAMATDSSSDASETMASTAPPTATAPATATATAGHAGMSSNATGGRSVPASGSGTLDAGTEGVRQGALAGPATSSPTSPSGSVPVGAMAVGAPSSTSTPGPQAAAPVTSAQSNGASQLATPSQQVVAVLAPLRSTVDGTHELTISLEPEGLGSVKATIAVGNGQVSVRLGVDSDEARNALRQALPMLQHELSDNGSSASVVVSDERQQSQAGQSDGTSESSQADDGPDDELASTTPRTQWAGQIDLHL